MNEILIYKYVKKIGNERKNMKKNTASVLIPLVLLSMLTTSGAGAGTISEPLISRSYLEGTFSSSLKDDITASLNGTAGKAMSRLDELYKRYIGYTFASSFETIKLSQGDIVTLTSGSSFILISGGAELVITGGVVVNISTGEEMESGSKAALLQRYFCVESTSAVFTAIAETVCQVDGLYSTTGKGPARQHSVFKDVKEDEWYFAPIDFVYKNGLFSGTSQNTFSPGSTMTRAMFVTVLYRLEGQPAQGLTAPSFSDVRDPAQYYYNAVAWASANGIVTGYSNGTFGPNGIVTREQMATFMHRYASFKQRDMNSDSSALESFPDGNGISSYAVDAIRWAVSKGVINGSNGRLLPQGSATRAQVAQIFLNYCEHVK